MEQEAYKTDWKTAFAELKAFVAAHFEIRMTPKSLAVPKNCRPEFYARVETVEQALAAALLGDLRQEGEGMAARLTARLEGLTKSAGLKRFQLAAALENFTADPAAAMARPIFGLVLDGLQQEMPAEEMERRALALILPSARDLLRNAYEAWVYYGIVAALKPVHFWGIQSPDTVEVRLVETDTIRVGWQVTSPERRMPEAVFETEDGRLFAMKSETAAEIGYYGTRIKRKVDFSSGGNTSDEIAHRILLLYRLESLEDAGLLANREKMYIRPNDLMCEFLLPSEMEQPQFLARFAEGLQSMCPRRPVQVLTLDERGEFPAELLEKLPGGRMERQIVGFDEVKIAAIAAKLG